MSLSDATLSDAPAAITVKAEPLDSKHFASELLKAFEAKDVNAIDDALRGHYAACEAEDDKDDEGSSDEE